MCDYYGQAEDEEAPHALIERLSTLVLSSNRIDVRLRSEVLDVRPNRILVLSSDVSSASAAKQSLYWMSFSHLALAVGADYGGSSPLGQGNVCYAHHVFRMAVDYAVRPTKQLSVLTGGNSGYRLGQLLLEAGIDLEGGFSIRGLNQLRDILILPKQLVFTCILAKHPWRLAPDSRVLRLSSAQPRFRKEKARRGNLRTW